MIYKNKAPFSVCITATCKCAWQHSLLSPVCVCWIEVLWVSGAAGDWEEELNQASFVDQLSLAELCHSKLGPLHPEPGEVLTCKWRAESSKAPRLLSKMLQEPKTVPWDAPLGVRKHTQPHHRLKCASQSGIMLMIELPSGHQTVSTLIELFTDDMGSHYVGSCMKHVNSIKSIGILYVILSYKNKLLHCTILFNC